VSLADEAEQFAASDSAAAAAARLETERKKHQATRRELTRTQERVDELEQLLERYTVTDPSSMVVPKWTQPRRTRKAHHATALLLLSDLHLDEVVNPAEINGLNAYNRKIAEARLQGVIEGTIELCDRYVSGVEIDGIVCAILGDLLTGDIHEELARTNEAPVMDSVTHWVPLLAAALTRLADAFGHVHVPCVDGNHDRFYKRTPAKQRATSSVAWVFYNWLAGVLADDKRITFSLTPAPEQVVGIYDTRFLLSHGDGFRSAGGIGGIYPSMLKFLHRKHRFEATGQPWDVALMGHWHQYLTGPDFCVNGSLKSYDEYAAANGFGYEPARQALAIVTPERGIVQQMPVYAD
jgi:predicted phosphodiesterase